MRKTSGFLDSSKSSKDALLFLEYIPKGVNVPFFMWVWKWEIVKERYWEFSKELLTMIGKVGCESHTISRLKGLWGMIKSFIRLICMGQWSKYVRRR